MISQEAIRFEPTDNGGTPKLSSRALGTDAALASQHTVNDKHQLDITLRLKELAIDPDIDRRSAKLRALARDTNDAGGLAPHIVDSIIESLLNNRIAVPTDLVTSERAHTTLQHIAVATNTSISCRILALDTYFASSLSVLNRIYLGRKIVSDNTNPSKLTHRAGRLVFALLEYSDLSATQTATFANDFYWSRQVDMKTRHGLLRLLRTIAKDDPHLCSTLVGDSLEAPTVVTRRNEPYEVDFVKAAQTFVRGVTEQVLREELSKRTN